MFLSGFTEALVSILIFISSNAAFAADKSISYNQSNSTAGSSTELKCFSDATLRCDITKSRTTTHFVLFDDSGAKTVEGSDFRTIPESLFSEFTQLRQVFDQLFLGNASRASRESLFQVLNTTNPDGYFIVTHMPDPIIFDRFTSSIPANFSKATIGLSENFEAGVHESLHSLDGMSGFTSYYLIDGSTVCIPSLTTFNRSRIKELLDSTEIKQAAVSLYLNGPSGAQGFNMLLEELNAYGHGVNANIEVGKGIGSPGVLNPYFLSMMLFAEKYVELAHESEPSTYSALTGKAYQTAISAIWIQALKVLDRACRENKLILDPSQINQLFITSNKNAIESLTQTQITFPESCRN